MPGNKRLRIILEKEKEKEPESEPDDEFIDESSTESSVSSEENESETENEETLEDNDIDYDSIMNTTLNAASVISDGAYASDSTDFFSGGAFIGDILTDVLSGGYLEDNEVKNDMPVEDDNFTNTPFTGGSTITVNPSKIVDGFPYKLKSTPEF